MEDRFYAKSRAYFSRFGSKSLSGMFESLFADRIGIGDLGELHR